jgi:hypothetical protein
MYFGENMSMPEIVRSQALGKVIELTKIDPSRNLYMLLCEQQLKN